jgi:glycosyltransferase involved in cell wall biosynthesis
MVNRQLRILQVSTFDIAGGAENVASNLFRSYRARGHSSWLAVGYKRGKDPDVIPIPRINHRGSWSRFWLSFEKQLHAFEGIGYALSRTLLRTIANPLEELGPRFGLEDFNHPGTHRLLELVPNKPDIVHCHNLHGGYFDLRFVPWLSQQVPLVLTLHDAWLLSGHCHHSFGCERWKTGCGHCPDLTIYPSIQRDATAHNWRRKREIYAKSNLYLATPSRWLMQEVEQSMLAPTVAEARVIPNGVDLSVFHPSDKQVVREALNILHDAKVLLFTSNRIRQHRAKDYQTMRSAVALVADRLAGQSLLFIALGEEAAAERIGQAEIRFVPYKKDPEMVARYYQAADIYIHAARAENFPTTVLEALACGTPVVATAVGGIPEQVKALEMAGAEWRMGNLNRYGTNEATGVLVPPGDARGMALGIERLLKDHPLSRRLGENAARDARTRFDLQRQVSDYLRWYEELLCARNRAAH